MQDNYAKINAIISEYFSNKNSMNETYLLSVKDKMLAYMYYFGETEADCYEMKNILDAEYESAKIEKFKQDRADKVAEKTADYNARLYAMSSKIEFIKKEAEYRRARNVKETLSKIIDSISQKISILRRENEFNQFQKSTNN